MHGGDDQLHHGRLRPRAVLALVEGVLDVQRARRDDETLSERVLIQPAVEALENARRDVRNAHKADEGRLRISAPTWLGKTVLPPILSGFRELYPKMCFEISLSDGLINIVDDDYDLAIRISSAPSDKFTIWRKIVNAPDTMSQPLKAKLVGLISMALWMSVVIPGRLIGLT